MTEVGEKQGEWTQPSLPERIKERILDEVEGELDVVIGSKRVAEFYRQLISNLNIDPFKIKTVVNFGCGGGREVAAALKVLPKAKVYAVDVGSNPLALSLKVKRNVKFCRGWISDILISSSLPPQIDFGIMDGELLFASIFSHVESADMLAREMETDRLPDAKVYMPYLEALASRFQHGGWLLAPLEWENIQPFTERFTNQKPYRTVWKVK